MKRFFTILAISLLLIPCCSARKICVMEVDKSGGHWLNLFNLYASVRTIYQSEQNNVIYVKLACEGAGFSFCRASRQVGHMELPNCSTNTASSLLNNPQIIQAINDLIELSEQNFVKGKISGTASKKVAIVGSKAELYFVNAEWKYQDEKSGNPGDGKVTISIIQDESNLLRR